MGTTDQKLITLTTNKFVSIIIAVAVAIFTVSGLVFTLENLTVLFGEEIYARKQNDKEVLEITEYQNTIQNQNLQIEILKLKLEICQDDNN